MTNQEFSNEFDVLYNNIMSNSAPGLDEYEKSVFLTNAQNDIIRYYFNPRENKPQQGFDDSKKRQMDFSALMKSKTLVRCYPELKFDNRSVAYKIPSDLLLFVNEACQDKNYRYVVSSISFDEYDRLMLKPYQYPIKRGVWRLISDSANTSIVSNKPYGGFVKNSSNNEVTVIFCTTRNIESEINTDTKEILAMAGIGRVPKIVKEGNNVTITIEFDRSAKGYEYYNAFISGKTTASYYDDLILCTGWNTSGFPSNDMSDMPIMHKVTAPPMQLPQIELIGVFDEDSLEYTVRYVRKPRPIVLTDLQGLSIQGVSNESTCELDDSLHLEILQRAVESAKAAYTGDLQSQIALGQASRTDIGIIPQSR